MCLLISCHRGSYYLHPSNPVGRCGHFMRKCYFDMRMNIDEVNRTGPRSGRYVMVT